MLRFIGILAALLLSLSGQAQGVLSAEYFWDADPGQGNGTPMQATDASFGDAIEEIVASDSELLPVGPHTFNIRVRDINMNWGPVFSVVVNIEPSIATVRDIQITAGESFWDSDPGAGNGTAFVAFDGDIDAAIELMVNAAITVPDVGIHTLNIRVRDAENNWGPLFSMVVSIEPAISTVREIRVTAAEYYFDNDPGPGNGTAMLALDGNFNAALKAIRGGAIPQPIEEGVHVLWMRARDAESNWGPAFGVVVNMDTTITGLVAQINGITQQCANEPLNGLTYSANAVLGSTYAWTVTNGAIVSGQGTMNVVVNWNPSGLRTLTLTQCLGDDCDEASITLVVNPVVQTANEVNICNGASFFVGGGLQTQPGTYTDVFQMSNGCDSTVVTTLSVIDAIETAQSLEICSGESVFLGGSLQTISGVYTDTFTSAEGCDSVVVTTLAVANPILVETQTSVCQGGSVFLAGDFQSVPGDYTEVFASVNGCDSVVITTLSVLPAPQLNESVQICSGQSIFLGGANQTEPGIYTDIVNDPNGCETIVITSLSVVDQFEVTVNTSICEGDSLFVGGAWQQMAGAYSDSYTSTVGCDSLVVTNLSLLAPLTLNEAVSICAGDSLFVGGDYQFEAGAYTDVFMASNGCDSIVVTTLNLLDAPQPLIDFTGGVLTTGMFSSYQWYFAGEVIDGAVNQFFLPQNEGEYVVLVTNADGCSGFAEPFVYIVDNVANHPLLAQNAIYPNPNDGRFMWSCQGCTNVQSLRVFDLNGRMVAANVVNADHQWRIDMFGAAAGVYLVVAETDEGMVRKQVVIVP